MQLHNDVFVFRGNLIHDHDLYVNIKTPNEYNEERVVKINIF